MVYKVTTHTHSIQKCMLLSIPGYHRKWNHHNSNVSPKHGAMKWTQRNQSHPLIRVRSSKSIVGMQWEQKCQYTKFYSTLFEWAAFVFVSSESYSQ